MGTFDTLARPSAATRHFLGNAADLGLGGLLGAASAGAQSPPASCCPSPTARPITEVFRTGPMILQRSRPPQLETPFGSSIRASSRPTTASSCAGTCPRSRWRSTRPPSASGARPCRQNHQLTLDRVDQAASSGGGCRRQPVLGQLARLLRAARGRRAVGPTARWAMPAGPAMRLKDVLDRAGVAAGAAAVRFTGWTAACCRRRRSSGTRWRSTMRATAK